MAGLKDLENEARRCTLCEPELPLGANPVFRISETAKILLIGQAPGTRVHESGVPWNDRSGDRLREWMNLDRETFYDESRIAIVPMGFCYPGVLPRGGDKPPRPECAPQWHGPMLELMPQVELTLLIGAYAQAYYLGKRRKKTMTETVRAWGDYTPEFLPTPHPSWRNTAWLKKNPWFEAEILPWLRARVTRLCRL